MYFDLDEQVHVRIIAVVKHGGDAADLHAVQQLFLLKTHDIHGHLTGNQLHTSVNGLLDERFEAVDTLLFHNATDHLSTRASHVHLRKTQLFGALGQHHAEHFAHKVLFDGWGLGFAQNAQPPEGKEHVHFIAHRGGAGGDDESGDGFIKVVIEDIIVFSLTGAGV